MASYSTSPWSYWEMQSFLGTYPVAVIGSGIVGLSAAIELKALAPDLPIVVLERGVLPTGASTRNAGFACFGSMTELLDDLATHNPQTVWDLVERRYRGLQRLREKLGDVALRYEPLGGFEIFQPHEAHIFSDCKEAMPVFNTEMERITGIAGIFQETKEDIARFGFKQIDYLIQNRGEGQIHTGEMMRALLALAKSKGIEILNGFQVDAIVPDSGGVWLKCPAGDLFFEKVLVATNGMAQRLLPALEVHPARNQVLITKPIPGLKLKGSFHYDKGYCYFRNIDDRILLGGARNLDFEVEQTDEFGTTTRIQDALVRLLHEVIAPDHTVEIDRWWSGIMGVGTVKSPIIKQITPHLTVAVRLGGMGVALGTLVGEEAAERMLQ